LIVFRAVEIGVEAAIALPDHGPGLVKGRCRGESGTNPVIRHYLDKISLWTKYPYRGLHSKQALNSLDQDKITELGD
jgi:hypothetical protein